MPVMEMKEGVGDACFGALGARAGMTGTGGGGYLLPLSTFVLELAGIAANVCGHASSVRALVRCGSMCFEKPALTAYCTPRSVGLRQLVSHVESVCCLPPVLNTSILFSPKHANISTLHLPSPRTATSFSISSSSLALMSICALSSPLANFSARPEMYSALR